MSLVDRHIDTSTQKQRPKHRCTDNKHRQPDTYKQIQCPRSRVADKSMVNVNVCVDCVHIEDKMQGTNSDIMREIERQIRDRPAVREEKIK